MTSRPFPSLLLSLALTGLTVTLAPSLAHAEGGKKLLTVEYSDIGQICLDGKDLTDLRRRLKDLIIPDGTAITLVAYSDAAEFATRARYTSPSPCVKRAVPDGIGNHERLATLRALQIAETAQELGLATFGGTPLLLLGANPGFRQRDPGTVVIVAQRGDGTGPADRRVEVWLGDALQAGTAAPAEGGTTLMLTPLLLPPSSYAASGGSNNASPSGQGSAPLSGDAWQPWNTLGWAMVGAGFASTVAGIFVLVHAADVDDRANATLNNERSIALSQQASDAWSSGGWAVGVGAGLTLFGTVMVLSLPDVDDDGAPNTVSVATGGLPGLPGAFGVTLQGAAF